MEPTLLEDALVWNPCRKQFDDCFGVMDGHPYYYSYGYMQEAEVPLDRILIPASPPQIIQQYWFLSKNGKMCKIECKKNHLFHRNISVEILGRSKWTQNIEEVT